MIYSTVITSRTGLLVPVFLDGRAAHSKYDPRREGERLAEAISPASFFVVSGVGGGYFIEALRRRFPFSPIIAAEDTKDDIAYLANHFPSVSSLIKDNTVAIVPLEELSSAITSRYIPALHGTLGIIEWEPWAKSNAASLQRFRAETKKASASIAADTSTQARFGKIWQRNILLNFDIAKHSKYFASNARQGEAFLQRRSPASKGASALGLEGLCALIAAAGPSLDDAIPFIKAKRKGLFVIATDTAYLPLTRQGIMCDAVLSIDGQQVSHSHFMADDSARPDSSRTLFVMDLTSDSATVRHLKEAGRRISFVRTGHPLSFYLAPDLPLLDSGGGTVTIAACDWARQAGFLHIAVAGADFAYIGGKPYSRGTYLDGLYLSSASRADSEETAFCRLMFRSPLIKGTSSTALLLSYKESFEAWLSCHLYKPFDAGHTFWKEYCAPRPKAGGVDNAALTHKAHTSREWIEEVQSLLGTMKSTSGQCAPVTPALFGLLPCAAYYRAHCRGMGCIQSLQASLDNAAMTANFWH